MVYVPSLFRWGFGAGSVSTATVTPAPISKFRFDEWKTGSKYGGSFGTKPPVKREERKSTIKQLVINIILFRFEEAVIDY